MKCPKCDVGMIELFGWSYGLSCAIGFGANDPQKPVGSYLTSVDLYFCPECGEVKADVEKIKEDTNA